MMSDWYIGFHGRASMGQILRREAPWTSAFTHVEAWGCSIDETWVFIDPRAKGTLVTVEHRYDEVMDSLNARFSCCERVYRVDSPEPNLPGIPLSGYNCVAVCASLVGIRAFTPGTFERKLRQSKAELVYDTQRRSGREESASA